MKKESHDEPDPVSEDAVAVEIVEETPDGSDEVAAPIRTVPLEALEAERRKRQDLEAQNRALQEVMVKSKAPQAPADEPEDEEEFITKADLKKRLANVGFAQKREFLEEAYCQDKPDNIEQINLHLEGIIKRKPWLAQTIESAPNRYARAYEIVQDYMPQAQNTAPAQKFSSPKADAQRIVGNAQKPGNPAQIAKAAQGSNKDYLKSIQGKPEFREYRKKMLAGA